MLRRRCSYHQRNLYRRGGGGILHIHGRYAEELGQRNSSVYPSSPSEMALGVSLGSSASLEQESSTETKVTHAMASFDSLSFFLGGCAGVAAYFAGMLLSRVLRCDEHGRRLEQFVRRQIKKPRMF